MAKPLTDHLDALGKMREDLDELLTKHDAKALGEMRPEAIEKLARARVAVADAIHHLREGYAAAGLRRTI